MCLVRADPSQCALILVLFSSLGEGFFSRLTMTDFIYFNTETVIKELLCTS